MTNDVWEKIRHYDSDDIPLIPYVVGDCAAYAVFWRPLATQQLAYAVTGYFHRGCGRPLWTAVPALLRTGLFHD